MAIGNAALRGVEQHVQAIPPLDKESVLKWLAVADADPVATDLAVFHREIGPYPVNVVWRDPDAAAGQSLVGVPLADIDDVPRDVRGDDEEGVFVPPDVEAFALADRVELRAVMPSYNLS